MKCGVAIAMNNDADLGRFVSVVEEGDTSKSKVDGVDNKVIEDDIRLGDQIEPLGFDSIWTFEHHGSPYIQIPDPLQWLSFWAGRTERIGVGSMLVIIPWHHPVRLAEQLVLLQHMLRDREMNIGVGRGLGLREYSALEIDMNESRERFVEGVEILQALISQETVEYHGKFFRIPNTDARPGPFSLRPRPRDAEKLLDSLYGGWIAPTSVPSIASLGLKPIIIPNKAFSDYVADVNKFAEVRAECGHKPARPIVATMIGYCGESESECDDVFQNFMKTATDPNNGTGGHASIEQCYEFAKNYHNDVPGYEFYGAKMAEIAELAAAGGAGAAPSASDEAIGIATPDVHIQRLTELVEMLGAEQLVVQFNGPAKMMPIDLAEKSMRLFAKEVLPAIHDLKVPAAVSS